MSELTKELLLLSELDNAAHLTFNDHIHLNALIKDIVRHEHYRSENKDLVIMTELEDVYFLGNDRLIHQAFSNLIINAIKYSPQQGMIQMRLFKEASNIILQLKMKVPFQIKIRLTFSRDFIKQVLITRVTV